MPRVYEPESREYYLQQARKKGYTPAEVQTLNELMINDPGNANYYLNYPDHRVAINARRGINNDVAQAEFLRIQESNARINEHNRIRQEREAFENAQRRQAEVEARAQDQIRGSEQQRAQREQERRAEHEAEQQQRAERRRAQSERQAQQREQAHQAGVMAQQAMVQQEPRQEYRAQPAPLEAAAQQQQEGRNPMLTREKKEWLFRVAHSSGLGPENIQRVAQLIRSGRSSDDIFQDITRMQDQERAGRGREPQPFIDPSEFERRAQRSLREYEQAERAGNQAAAAVQHRPYEDVKEGQEAHYQQQAHAQQQAQAEQAAQEARARVAQEFAERERERQAQQQAYEASAAQLNREQFSRSFPHVNLQPDPPFASPQPSPGHAEAIADAMARAQAAGNFQAGAAPALSAQDPSVPSTHTNIDPARRQANYDIMQRAEKLSRQPPLPMASVESRFAFHTPQERVPLEMARHHGIQQPYYEQAQRRTESAHQRLPYGVQEYMNPYHHHVVRKIAEEGNRNLFENIMPTLEARYIKLGQHGGQRHHDLSARAIRDVQKEISSQQAMALANAYENAAQHFNVDQARQLEAAKMHSMLGQQSQASRLADIAALQEAEQEQRGFRQNLKDYEQHELQRLHNHPQEMLNMYSQLVQGQPYSTSTHRYAPSQPQSLHRRDYQSAILPFLTRMGSHFVG